MALENNRVPGQIIAMGGGGFSMTPENSLLDEFVLSRVRRRPVRVCFVPTASADSATYIAKFYRAFANRKHVLATDLTLNDAPALPRRPGSTAELAAFVPEQDIFYVGGGNTAHLLSRWRLHGLDKLLRKAWRNGAILAGISAGMICWFENGLTDSFGGLAPLGDGLGLLKGSACPHYDGEAERRGAYQKLIQRGGLPGGYAADDGVALHFVGTKLRQVVSERLDGRAFRVTRRRGQLSEEALSVRYLG